jgi:hypothetical protein
VTTVEPTLTPTPTTASDDEAIAAVVRVFFAAFSSGPGTAQRLAELRALFLPRAVIVRTCGLEPTVYTVGSFIEPRQKLLTDGTLVDFSEWVIDGVTVVFGDIAQHWCTYAKAGVQNGTPFATRGRKSIQLVRTSAGWRISAAAWDDERPGVQLDDPTE